eukprot:s906_g11.t1
MADVILGERSRAVTVGRSHFATADDEELGRQVEEWQAAPGAGKASMLKRGPEATQAHPTEEWTLARLERKVMEEESFEKRRKSSSAMRALEECYEDAAWDSFDVSETAEVAPAQPTPMGVQVPQELRRPEAQPKLPSPERLVHVRSCVCSTANARNFKLLSPTCADILN